LSTTTTGTQRSRTRTHIAYGAISSQPALNCWYSSNRDVDMLQGFVSLVVINSIGGLVFEVESLASLEKRLGLPDLSHAFMHVCWAHRRGQALNAEAF
jgi:hypothetical protein